MFRTTNFYIKGVTFIMKFTGIGFILFSCNTKKVETFTEIKISQSETESKDISISPTKQPDYSLILKSQAESYQKSLDKGEFMMEYSQKYAEQMDSMLNVVYRHLINKYDQDEKRKLKMEQRVWIKERDNKLKEIWANANAEGPMGMDDMMIAYDKEAKYIKQRVEQLIFKIQNTTTSLDAPSDESYYGGWTIKKFFIRSGITGMNDEEASKFVGEVIIFGETVFSLPMGRDLCPIANIKMYASPIDEEAKRNFNLQNSSLKTLEIDCGKHTEYFNILLNDKAIYEADGAVFLLEKK